MATPRTKGHGVDSLRLNRPVALLCTSFCWSCARHQCTFSSQPLVVHFFCHPLYWVGTARCHLLAIVKFCSNSLRFFDQSRLRFCATGWVSFQVLWTADLLNPVIWEGMLSVTRLRWDSPRTTWQRCHIPYFLLGKLSHASCAPPLKPVKSAATREPSATSQTYVSLSRTQHRVLRRRNQAGDIVARTGSWNSPLLSLERCAAHLHFHGLSCLCSRSANFLVSIMLWNRRHRWTE